MENKIISIIIPAYNESVGVRLIGERLKGIFVEKNIPYEIIFVDDGSQDDTYQYIIGEAKKNENVTGVRFSRNFGKEAAMKAGLDYVNGGCCVIIDCDMQHPPEKIVEMYHLWLKGYEIVEGVKSDRGNESSAYKFASKKFYDLMSRTMKLDMENASDFKLFDKKVVQVLRDLPEKNMFLRGLSSWVGFKTTKVYYCVEERQHGESKWKVKQLINYAINNITSFSNMPLKAITFLGMVLLIGASILSIHTFAMYFAGVALEGFTTVILTTLFMSSILMISLGVIGYYMSKIYEEVKDRPVYIISEETERIPKTMILKKRENALHLHRKVV